MSLNEVNRSGKTCGNGFTQSMNGEPNPKRLRINYRDIELHQTLQQATLLDAFALAVKQGNKTFRTPGEMGLRDIHVNSSYPRELFRLIALFAGRLAPLLRTGP
ncbi:hypothetical protein [Planctomycetes bacterium K23_9]|uniref:hypothetical protein n=1 Tax=Stieleria marina TaxID=1930275 RepID=UPI00119C9B42